MKKKREMTWILVEKAAPLSDTCALRVHIFQINVIQIVWMSLIWIKMINSQWDNGMPYADRNAHNQTQSERGLW